MFDKDYDVFIAYHGSHDKESGTLGVSQRLHDYLSAHGINAYFFPNDSKDSYKTTILEVMRAKTFLLVCNKNLAVTSNFRIDQGRHYQLLAEIDTFYALTQTADDVSTLDAKILACGEFDGKIKEGNVQEFHQLFDSRTHTYCHEHDEDESFATILEWIEARKVAWSQRGDSWQKQQISTEIQYTLVARSSMGQFCNLSSKVAVAKKIRICGITNLELISKVDDTILRNAIINGAEVEMLFLNPDCKEMVERMEEEKDTRGKLKRKTRENIEEMLDFVDALPDDCKDRVQLYTYDLAPRINMIEIDDFMVLQYYASFASGKDNPCFLLERKEISPIFDFCEDNQEQLKLLSTKLEV